VVCTVPLAGHTDAVLHLTDELIYFPLLVEVETVGKVNDPSVGMVTGKSRKNLNRLVVVA
jgi:hypothetical protein